MRRICEIVSAARSLHPKDDFFTNFEEKCRTMPAVSKTYRAYGRALAILDNESWTILKSKALRHYLDHREGQKKQGFFHQLNEAFAYRHLVNQGFHDVRFLKEGRKKTPDIAYVHRGVNAYCEVKSLGISEDEIVRRNTIASFDPSIYSALSDGFANKFHDAARNAMEQILSWGTEGLVYIVVVFDDFTLSYYENYRSQLVGLSHTIDSDNLFVKIGLRGNRRISTKRYHQARDIVAER
jgi:hypothetical protein